MRKYQKPRINVLCFLSKEAISQSLDEWLTAQPDIKLDPDIANAIDSYDVSSLIM